MANQNQNQESQQNVENVVSGVEQFFKTYQKVITIVIVATVVIVCAILAANKWIINPAKEEARARMFPAEQLFDAGRFEVALNGDSTRLGFASIIDNYGSKAGKSVYFYAGICALQTGDNDAAISYLKKYRTSDKIMKAKALCCIGDAYANKGELESALSYFKKAAGVSDNDYTAGYLMKAGIISEEMGNDEEALKCYEEIKVKYPQTMEGYDIEKYISRINSRK